MSEVGMFSHWWHRVFSAQDVQPEPAALLEHLNRQGLAVSGHFHGDEQGWFAVDLAGPDLLAVRIERFLAGEEGIRAELNSWAAWLETQEHAAVPQLMLQVVSAAQVFTVQQPVRPLSVTADLQVCEILCRCLAVQTGGIYQLEGQGLFAADGTLLVASEE
jgi:hypothetical protein